MHSLPGLKQLLHVPLPSLSLTRALCTFHVSGQGQAIFMSSDSELQRLSVVAEDKLNLPACLPDLHVALTNPSPHHGGVGKRILDALFTSGPATVDREQLCECVCVHACVRAFLCGCNTVLLQCSGQTIVLNAPLCSW